MIYLTFVGNHDDFSDSSESHGAVFNIFSQFKTEISKIYILVTPKTDRANYPLIARKNKALIEESKPGIEVHFIEINLTNPIDFDIVYPVMLDETQKILDLNDNRNEKKIINITSGTPTMTACWVVLSKSGLIPNSKLVQSFESRFAQQRGESTQIVDFRKLDDFPEIKAPNELKRQLTIISRERDVLDEKIKQKELDEKIPELIGDSKPIREIKDQILSDLDQKTNVLIIGERGIGKQVVADVIWRLYHTVVDTRLTTFDCGSFQPNLVASELFGYKKGAFTGAVSDKPGILSQTDGKMIFLDEIGNMAIEGQNMLLRFINDGEFKPIGTNDIVKVDTQILAATNKNINDSTLFAQDLKDRFDEIIELPSLKERKEDIGLLIKHFLYIYSGNKLVLGKDVIGQLENHDWPGNVRELEKFIQKLIRRFEIGEVSLKDLPDRFINLIMSDPDTEYELPELPLPVPLPDYAELIIEKARKHAGGKYAEVDKLLKQNEGAEKQRQYRKRKGI